MVKFQIQTLVFFIIQASKHQSTTTTGSEELQNKIFLTAMFIKEPIFWSFFFLQCVIWKLCKGHIGPLFTSSRKKQTSTLSALSYFRRVLKEKKTKVNVTNYWLNGFTTGGVLMSLMTSQRAMIIFRLLRHMFSKLEQAKAAFIVYWELTSGWRLSGTSDFT